VGESVGEGATAFRGATAQKVQNNFRTEMETALNIIAAFPALSLIERNRHIELSRSGARRFHCRK
jgi:hypothetical protein